MDWLEFFSGGVPALEFFRMQTEHVKELASKSLVDAGVIDFGAELCIIGLAAYFEAFCKNQFAAIINVCPETLEPFTAARECTIPVKNLLHNLPRLSPKLGFIVAEEYDFGSAKAINGLFNDLLKVAPFSKTEMADYNEFVNDRNLLVHHGGVFTFKYASQKFGREKIERQANWNSLVVGKADVHKRADFLLEIAVKTGNATSTNLFKFAKEKGLQLHPAKKAAIKAFRAETSRL